MNPQALESYGKIPYDSREKELMGMSKIIAAPTARLEARIDRELHPALKHAAALQGRTMTDFVVSAVQDAVHRTIENANIILLTMADQEVFVKPLLSPSEDALVLKRAFERRSAPLGE